MGYERFKQIIQNGKMMKYNEELKMCEYYLAIMNNEMVTGEQIQKIERFSNNLYLEIVVDNPDIAAVNTAKQRNINSIENMKMNLVALKKMLDECLVKEGERSNGEGKEF